MPPSFLLNNILLIHNRHMVQSGKYISCLHVSSSLVDEDNTMCQLYFLVVVKLCVSVFGCTHMHTCMWVLIEARRGYGIPWSWSYSWLWSSQCGCFRTEPKSPTIALTCRRDVSTIRFFFLCKVNNFTCGYKERSEDKRWKFGVINI